MDKEYLIFELLSYDDYSEEFNLECQCLSEKYINSQKRFDFTINTTLTIKECILENLWDKEDVDEFTKKYPESLLWVFKIYRDNYRWERGKKNYYEYCPLTEQRENKIKMIYENS